MKTRKKNDEMSEMLFICKAGSAKTRESNYLKSFNVKQ